MAASRVGTLPRLPLRSSQTVATRRSHPCAAESKRTARREEVPRAGDLWKILESHRGYRFWRPKVFLDGPFFFAGRAALRWNGVQLAERRRYSLHSCENQRCRVKLCGTDLRRIAIGCGESRRALSCCPQSQRVAARFSRLHALAMKNPACPGQDVKL